MSETPPSEIGAERRTRFEFDQADFDEYARLSGDDNPIHVDPVFAAASRFGTTVAHGMLLFSRLSAATADWLGGARAVTWEELTFPAPTPAGVPLTATLRVVGVEPGGAMRVAQEIATSDGTVTAVGATVVGSGTEPPSQLPVLDPSSAESFGGMRLGMSASTERRLTRDDVVAWRRLVHDANPRHQGDDPMAPPALMVGTISKVLGTQMPGSGTNWLRQRYRFARPVKSGETLVATVEVIRLRPDKDLVDLRTTIEVGGELVVDGQALVLVREVVGPA